MALVDLAAGCVYNLYEQILKRDEKMTETGMSVSQRVEKVARAVQLFTSEELAQLVSLVPRLREIELFASPSLDIFINSCIIPFKEW